MGNMCKIFFFNKFHLNRTAKTDAKKKQSRTTTGEVLFNVAAIDFINEKNGEISNYYDFFDKPLGQGAFGEVRKALHKITGTVRAIKVINKNTTSDEEQKRLINEVEILKKLDHPNIIKIYEFFQDSKFLYIVTELYSGGELFDKIVAVKHFSERQAADIIRQILSAIYYCHRNNIVHRDLKPENILYESEKPDSLLKIIDFGTSKSFNTNQKMTQKFGTPYYIAPEVLRKKYDEKCDIWSIGVILYILLCGYPPFNGPNDKVIMEKVAKGIYTFPPKEWNGISDEAKRFIKRLLEYNSSARYTASEAINDPWIKDKMEVSNAIPSITQNVMLNLKSFRATHKLQHAIWVFMVSFLATREEKSELFSIFKTLDLNGDGQLTRDELLTGYRKIMNSPTPEQDVDHIMKMVDVDESGVIDYTEFVMATISRKSLLDKQRLSTAFKVFDKDGNGFISVQELKDFFNSSNLPDKIWQDIIKEFDENGDGQISYKEFKDMMMHFS